MKSDNKAIEGANKEEQSTKQEKEKPKILPLPNGPYYLLNDTKPKIVENLQNSKGDQSLP
jgi:hypothetical protein